LSFFAPEFLLAFPVIYCLFHAIASWRWRLYLLLLSSLAFYYAAAGTKAWALLVVAGAAWLGQANGGGLIRLWPLLLFAPLFYYKYIIWWSSGVASAMAALPAGLSFFSFQSYAWARSRPALQVRDASQKDKLNPIQRGQAKIQPGGVESGAKAGQSLAQFLLYISFFPQVVAGPIVPPAYSSKIKAFLLARLSLSGFRKGLFLMAAGFLCKTLADALAAIADPVFQSPGLATGGQVALAWLAFSLQIYLDFSAYSSLAIGAGRLLNFRLPENFHFPYHARSLRSFWRRWHITLGMFLREHVYIKLGGNRLSSGRQALAIMITFLLGGLWHGAGWLFICWGLLHGLLLAGEQALRFALPERLKKYLRLLGHASTPLLVAMLWLPFRAGMSGGTEHFQALVGRLFIRQGWQSGVATGDLYLALAVVSLVAGAPWLYRFFYTQARRRSLFLVCFVAALVCLIALSLQTKRPFIYFIF
jgi:D-alanyl-lipoteichoic acid acyltransferase DltB (MBOAT superfamily)